MTTLFDRGLADEHARFLNTCLNDAEARVARDIMRAAGTYPATPRLGHRTTHTPQLHLGDYLAATAEPPARVHRGLFKGYTDVLGNNQWGDCGDAMTLHGIEGMRHAAGQAPPPFTEPDALNLYGAVSGFVPTDGPPGNNPTDQGTDNAQLVAYWQSTGVKCATDGSVHQIAGSVAVDATNDLECQIAIYELGVLFTAWNLPASAQGQTVWDVIGDGRTGNSAPGSWGGHDTATMAYTGVEFDTNTWGLWVPVTKRFRLAYQAGFFAVVAKDMLNRTGVSPSGLDWSALVADLQKLGSGSPIQ